VTVLRGREGEGGERGRERDRKRDREREREKETEKRQRRRENRKERKETYFTESDILEDSENSDSVGLVYTALLTERKAALVFAYWVAAPPPARGGANEGFEASMAIVWDGVCRRNVEIIISRASSPDRTKQLRLRLRLRLLFCVVVVVLLLYKCCTFSHALPAEHQSDPSMMCKR
jgi:hypothetical protein